MRPISTSGITTVFSMLANECMRTPVNSSEWRSDAPETMQPPDTSELTAWPRRPSLVVHELCRRRDLAIGPDRPLAVVEIERGNHVGQIDIRLPVGVERADVAPIRLASKPERTQDSV